MKDVKRGSTTGMVSSEMNKRKMQNELLKRKRDERRAQ